MSRTSVASQVVQARATGVAEEMQRAASNQASRAGVVARSVPLAPARPIEVPTASPIHTPRFSLRPLAARDRREFLRVLRASSHVERFMPLRHGNEADESVFVRQLALARQSSATGQSWRRVAVDSAGRIVGGFNLINIERGLASRADANWWVAGDALRQRIATECLYAMLDLGLADAPGGLGLTEINAHVQLDNEASLRLVARVGLRATNRPNQTLCVGEHWLLHRTFVKTALDRG